MQNAPKIKDFKLVVLFNLVNDPINYLNSLQKKYGDISQSHFLGNTQLFLSHPTHAEHILSTHQDNYQKNTLIAKRFEPFLGKNNLTTTNNIPQWTHDRALAQVAMDTSVYFEKYANVVTTHCQNMLDQWKRQNSFAVPFGFDIDKLILSITHETLFYKTNINIDSVAKHIPDIFAQIAKRTTSIMPLLWILPTAQRRQYNQVVNYIHTLADDIVKSRLALGKDYDDILGTLLHDYQVTQPSSENFQTVRDLVISLTIAGYLPTTSILRSILLTLSQHPDTAKNIVDEVSRICHKTTPTYADFIKLKYTQAVVSEVLRLYPPLIYIFRESINEDEMNGFRIPAKAGISLTTSLVNRHPDYWKHPDTFMPERFLTKPLGQDYPFAYIPFGSGNRACLGKNFGFMLACLCTAMMAKQFIFKLPNNQSTKMGYVASMFQRPLAETIMVQAR